VGGDHLGSDVLERDWTGRDASPRSRHGAKRREVHVEPSDVDLDDLVSDVAELAGVQPVALLPADCFPPGRYRALVRYGVPLSRRNAPPNGSGW